MQCSCITVLNTHMAWLIIHMPLWDADVFSITAVSEILDVQGRIRPQRLPSMQLASLTCRIHADGVATPIQARTKEFLALKAGDCWSCSAKVASRRDHAKLLGNIRCMSC